MSAVAAPAAETSASSAPPPANKKRKMEDPDIAPNISSAADLQVLHQTTELSLLYLRHPTTSWHAHGRTTLYVINDVPGNFAMHLRGSCHVLNVTVETLQPTTTTSTTGSAPMDVDGAPPSAISLVSVPVKYEHNDPLTHVLTKPSHPYTGNEPPTQYDADSQWIRGATGMTSGLRAASIASYMGELRISPSVSTIGEKQVSKEDARIYWMHDLQDSNNKEGSVAQELGTKLFHRSTKAREARIKLVAERLADASSSSQTDSKDGGKLKVMKVTIVYDILLDQMPHLGGIHSIQGHSPHVYTTTGILGDHEGPRTWIPCLDSASSKHRASHELVMKVTAPMRDGLSVVGCGQDYGVSKSLLHDVVVPAHAAELLGESHVKMVNDTVNKALSQNAQKSEEGSFPHVIPLDPSSVDSVVATTVWASQVWAPAPIRSLGFAVGPFKVLEDPEYFREDYGGDDEEEDETQDANETDNAAFVEAARENGEGVRQVYFAPVYERKYIHLSADMSLLHQTFLELPRLGQRFVEMTRDMDQAVLVSTVGVPLRALSLVRDVLALPTYRTASYTQIWIPDAIHGGSTSGALHCCAEVMVNPFVGGSIMDARLLSPIGARLPYYNGGRVLQMIQARCVVRGWITAALPLGEGDDVGFGYLYTLIESFLMSLYERGHGAFGEGGAKNSVFYTKRYASRSGLNSSALDFLPISNIEEAELDPVVGGLVGAVPIEDRNSDQLWRTASNGTESHTSAVDELGVRQVLYKDSVDAIERGKPDKTKNVALPSLGYLGSHFSLSFLSTNASSSSELGCGAVELLHPVGGATYRALKCEILRRVVEGRAGVANFIRLVRAAFIAAHLEDIGKKELQDEDWQYKKSKHKKTQDKSKTDEKKEQASDHGHRMRPPFLLCVEELLKKHGLTHLLFTRALRILSGALREPHLRGTLVDVERETRMPGNGRHYVEPESFPNSYVRGASEMYLRVGAHVEPAATGGTSSAKGTQLQLVAEPVIPHGGIAFGGPVTVRVVENEGALREFVRSMIADGSRYDWGPIALHAKPVTTTRQQNAASGGIEGARGSKTPKSSEGNAAGQGSTVASTAPDAVFSESSLHNGGYQALELIRLTNKTPLLWVRVDPMGIYGGRIAIIQPDACLAEQLFHDGDSGAQVDALRALAERPFKIQGSVKITTVYGADVSELPVRVLGDCLRGSVALHSSLPHTPAVRVQAAYAIAQWQNNREIMNKATNKADWIGLNLLLQYFRERFDDNGNLVPVNFARVVLEKDEDQVGQNPNEAGVGTSKTGEDGLYQYLDTLESPEERRLAIKEAAHIEVEEDEEYRVRSAVVQAIASIRADDGTTPSTVLRFLEEILVSGDCSMVRSFVAGDIDIDQHKLSEKDAMDLKKRGVSRNDKAAALEFVPSIVVADALYALCAVNASTPPILDPKTGTVVHSSNGAEHPSLPLILASHRWLEWELYRETIRAEAEATTLTGVGGGTHSTVAACAATALCSLCITKQSTTDLDPGAPPGGRSKSPSDTTVCDLGSSVQYYKNIFDGEPPRSDVTRAACAQAVACIYCATDRVEDRSRESVGLLSALEFLLDGILDSRTSPGLRQTLALLMMDACTGKICSTQRVAAIGGRGDLCTSAARFFTGPLGESYGGENGSALLLSVSEISYPAANAVNDGARYGLALLRKAGAIEDKETSNKTIARIAKFATSLWRTINGDSTPPPSATLPQTSTGKNGICAFDGQLRCTLLSLWMWLWPSRCHTVTRVQTWQQLMGKEQYKQLGGDLVMHSTEAEIKAAIDEEKSIASIQHVVEKEIDRQKWRGEMAWKAYEYHEYDKSKKAAQDGGAVTIDQGIGQPLPMIRRDVAFQRGGWIASAAQQRRDGKLDGGCKVTTVRLKMPSLPGA